MLSRIAGKFGIPKFTQNSILPNASSTNVLSGLFAAGMASAGIAYYHHETSIAHAGEKKALNNPFENDKNFNCFGCGPNNKHNGLKLKFFFDEGKNAVITRFTYNEGHVGFHNVVHGGLVATVVDEVAWWTFFHKFNKLGLTAKLETEYKGVVRPGQQIEARGTIESVKGRQVVVTVVMLDHEQKITSVSKVTFLQIKRPTAERIFGTLPPSLQKYVEDEEDETTIPTRYKGK
eukprot:TRINITY_DN12900_c0_g1_i1.p1 TRINITY_DN12900_c0_g1~~TRINITY_DN12900_c0_g1_i1.p1  ORF type:complete len:233 (-),score=15.20 TRINITY_DN12900_c0_g1_i1:38-736(-)